ncbi:hypothetical protein TDB9533_04184 [Thalassocella blandensis]|nr:hypothetical protein TDB9533_04184 [Thalassocella blandensis]
MKKSLLLALGICLSGGTLLTNSYADTVRIPAGHQGDNVWSGKTPSRGMNKAAVEGEFGAPDSKVGPNGNPPIYYWEYPDFTVYFESDMVLHTVIKHRPKS